MKFIIQTIYSILILTSITYGQNPEQESLDPYGYVTKYNPDFDGIGPRVYILPLPRTLAEEMIDTYEEILPFQDSIKQGMMYANLVRNYQGLYQNIPVNFQNSDFKTDKDYIKFVENSVAQKRYDLAYWVLNHLAEQNILNKQFESAKKQLINAIGYAAQSNIQKDLAILQSNLANLELFLKNYSESVRLNKSSLTFYTETNDLKNKALSITQLAVSQAYNKEYTTAENAIIRQAIPLHKKSKNDAGKINAWLALAEIYRLQNKHTEAQWFLLQAKDLARSQNYENQLGIIEYMLGSSKAIQRNYKVAKEELLDAYNLTDGESNKYLKLAIVDELGRTYTYLREYNLAKKYLDEYWILKKSDSY